MRKKVIVVVFVLLMSYVWGQVYYYRRFTVTTNFYLGIFEVYCSTKKGESVFHLYKQEFLAKKYVESYLLKNNPLWLSGLTSNVNVFFGRFGLGMEIDAEIDATLSSFGLGVTGFAIYDFPLNRRFSRKKNFFGVSAGVGYDYKSVFLGKMSSGDDMYWKNSAINLIVQLSYKFNYFLPVKAVAGFKYPFYSSYDLKLSSDNFILITEPADLGDLYAWTVNLGIEINPFAVTRYRRW